MTEYVPRLLIFGKVEKGNFRYHLLFWTGLYLLWVLLFRSYSVALTKTITIEFCYLHVFHSSVQDFNSVYLYSILNISVWVLLVTMGKMLIDRIQTLQQLDIMEK